MFNFKKVSIYSFLIYFSLFLINSKYKAVKADIVPVSICPSFESQKIYAVPTANNGTSCPSEDSNIIHVSTSGNDSNDGLSPSSPVKSLSNALSLVEKDSSDWIVVKRGDTFEDSFGLLRNSPNENALGGESIDRPLVITTYGESLERPIIKPEENGIELWGSFSNITISGLEFRSSPGTGGVGIRTLYNGTNYVIHNNYISGFGAAIVLQGNPNNNQWLSNVVVRENVITDSASSGKGHSQGMYAAGVQKLTIEENVFDRCGWYKDRNGQLPNSRIATIFNHCMYLQNGAYPATVKNNIVTRASSHGLQARSGAFVENNLFARNPLQFFLSSKGLNGNANTQPMWAKNNVVLEGNDINYQLERGLGIQHNNAYIARYEDNIVAHVLSLSKNNKKGIDITCRTDDVHTGITGQCKSRFSNNIVYNWGNELGGKLIYTRDFKNNLDIDHRITDNYFIIDNSQSKFIDVQHETLNNKYLFARNTYGSPNIMSEELFSLPAKYKASFVDWKNTVERTAQGVDYIRFSDPCRTMATYYDDMILGDTEDNCSILHDNEFFEEFISLAKQKNAMIEDSGIDVESVIEYVREGFALLPDELPSIYAD